MSFFFFFNNLLLPGKIDQMNEWMLLLNSVL